MEFVKFTTLPDHLVPTTSTPSSNESFEEWQARVCALDDAVREHLRPKGRQDWRYIDVAQMLGTWKAKRCEKSYLNLIERLMRMLEIFAGTGTMSPTVVHRQLGECEAFLKAQSPPLARERTLMLLAGKAQARVIKGLSGKHKAA